MNGKLSYYIGWIIGAIIFFIFLPIIAVMWLMFGKSVFDILLKVVKALVR